MAEQPSITSILAALASQHPTSSQSLASQPTFQSSANPHQAPYGGAQFTLPQPTNSGNVDLSSIKPVSSGTVSIVDAIAKAKAIAAEKGLSYDRSSVPYGANESRSGTGRVYRQSRSRSRSPPVRRDAFRDNYNPYRDERRPDRASSNRDPYVREGSFSPVSRSRGLQNTFSPPRIVSGNIAFPPTEKSPVGRGGESDTSEIIPIESGLVGLIIGRQGENLRRVESETGCRVQFVTGQDEGGPWRQCKITGPRARRADVKTEIERIVEESGMGSGARITTDYASRDAPPPRANSHQPALRDGEDSMQIMVPDRTVGLIIGRGGETIRDLQERSGCHVNIVGEQKSINGLRPVNLIGSREAAAKAKDLIMEIVESDSKGVTKERGVLPRDQSRDLGHTGGNTDKVNDHILVPSEAVGMIIGKGGETIKEMQNLTGCKINVSPSTGPSEVERQIGLIGSRDAVEKAKRAIEDKVDAVVKNGQGGGRNRSHQDYTPAQQSYALPQVQSQDPTSTTGDDPYAAYGGYQNYVALWYSAMAAQQQGGHQ